MLKAFSPTKTLLLFYNVIVVSFKPLLALPQWQRVKMLAEDLSEERKFCHLTSVYCPTLSQADPSPFSHLGTSGPFSHLRTSGPFSNLSAAGVVRYTVHQKMAFPVGSLVVSSEPFASVLNRRHRFSR